MRITFSPLGEGPGDGLFYREFDFNGTASLVPEPASAGLLTLGAMLLAWRRREGKLL